MIFIKDVKETAKMTNTDILLEDLEDVLDDATSIPLSKKYAVDVDKICLLYTSPSPRDCS